MARELPSEGFAPVEISSMRLTRGYYRYEIELLDERAIGHRMVINEHRGILGIGGRTITGYPSNPHLPPYHRYLGYTDPEVKAAYQDASEALITLGITIPDHDPKFSKAEEIIESVIQDPGNQIDLDRESVRTGMAVMLVGQESGDLLSRGRTSKIVYAGTVGVIADGPYFYFMDSPSNKSVSMDLARPGAWRLEYSHFTPEVQHLTDVYSWEEYVTASRSRYYDWTLEVYQTTQEVLDAVSAEVSTEAMSQRMHRSSWYDNGKNSPLRLSNWGTERQLQASLVS